MALRIAIAGLSHETNTYAVESFGTTGLDAFTILRGDEIIEQFDGVRLYVGGMLDAARELGAEVVPTFHAIAEPSGTVERKAYETMKQELLDSVAAALPLDAVALELHGAGVVEEIGDLEGDLLRDLRSLVGPEVKVVVALDLHGNLTEAMAESSDLMLGVHFYPHVDMYERGYDVVKAVPSLVSGDVRPVTHIEHLPMLLPPSTTDRSPAADMNELCWKLEEQPGVLDCTVFHGFPFTDGPEVGVHVIVTADGDRGLARETARTVARWIWDRRDEFRPELDTAELAVRRALAVERRPVVINETSDNPGGGAPGDSTHLLRALLDADVDESCFGYIYDPEVAEQAHRAGAGATIDVALGGKHDTLHGEPVVAKAYVKCLTDGRFTVQCRMLAGYRMELGRTARLQIGRLDVIVVSARSQTFDPEVFLLHGVDVNRCRIVALKSSEHFRDGFAELAAAIVTADPPGLTTRRIEVFERRHQVQPMWPKDPDASYSGS